VRTSWCVHYRGTGGKSESVSVQAGGTPGCRRHVRMLEGTRQQSTGEYSRIHSAVNDASMASMPTKLALTEDWVYHLQNTGQP
jgi:hypothetical protein